MVQYVSMLFKTFKNVLKLQIKCQMIFVDDVYVNVNNNTNNPLVLWAPSPDRVSYYIH